MSMVWVARMKDGSIRKQWENGVMINSGMLDKANVESFTLMETSEKYAAAFNSVSGFIDFRNLDYDKLKNAENFPDLRFSYDKVTSEFKMVPEDLAIFNRYLAEDPAQYLKVVTGCDGAQDVGGLSTDLNWQKTDGSPYVFRGSDWKFDYIVSAESYYGLSNSGVTTKLNSRAIRFSIKDSFNTPEFHIDRDLTVCYETRRVTMDIYLTAFKDESIVMLRARGKDTLRDRTTIKAGAQIKAPTQVITLL